MLKGGPEYDDLLIGGDFEIKTIYDFVVIVFGVLLMLNVMITVLLDYYFEVHREEEEYFAWQAKHLNMTIPWEVYWDWQRTLKRSFKCAGRKGLKNWQGNDVQQHDHTQGHGFEWMHERDHNPDPYFLSTAEMIAMLDEKKHPHLIEGATKVWEKASLGNMNPEREDVIGSSLLRGEFPTPSLAAELLMVAVGDELCDLEGKENAELKMAALEQFKQAMKGPQANKHVDDEKKKEDSEEGLTKQPSDVQTEPSKANVAG